MMSAWPQWRAVSLIMWVRMRRSATGAGSPGFVALARVERSGGGADDLVGASGRGLVGGDDLGAGPVGGHVHGEADLGAVAEEHGLEPVDLAVGHVLDEAEQVGARRHAGGALLFVGESLRGLDERLAHAAQVVEEHVTL